MAEEVQVTEQSTQENVPVTEESETPTEAVTEQPADQATETQPVETKPDEAQAAAAMNPAPATASISPVEANNRLSMVLQDVERLTERVHGLLNVGADVTELHDMLKKARLFIADKIGLVENEAGNLVPKV